MKKKLKKKAAIYNKKMEAFKGIIFDIPKKPLTAFYLYIKDNLSNLKQKYKNLKMKDIQAMASDEWQNEDASKQKKYIRIAESDRKRFKEELKQFEKLGYYKKRKIKKAYKEEVKKQILNLKGKERTMIASLKL